MEITCCRFSLCLFLPWNPLLFPVAGQSFPSNIFCLDFPYLLLRKNFKCCPPELLLCASEGVFQKDFCFFFPFSANISMVCFCFFLAEATRCLLYFFPNKFLSCRCNRSASSFNISLECCCSGQLRTAKILCYT